MESATCGSTTATAVTLRKPVFGVPSSRSISPKGCSGAGRSGAQRDPAVGRVDRKRLVQACRVERPAQPQPAGECRGRWGERWPQRIPSAHRASRRRPSFCRMPRRPAAGLAGAKARQDEPAAQRRRAEGRDVRALEPRAAGEWVANAAGFPQAQRQLAECDAPCGYPRVDVRNFVD